MEGEKEMKRGQIHPILMILCPSIIREKRWEMLRTVRPWAARSRAFSTLSSV